MEREAIVADYVVTGERIVAIMAPPARLADLRAPTSKACTDESRKPRAEFIERVLEVLDERDGGPEGWLAEHGFDPEPLRARLAA